jgi:creatinine amidohydrolase
MGKELLMFVQWEKLTSTDFEKAVARAEYVCLLPFGVVESHGDHLPLGTDLIDVRAIACRAAEKEYAVVFPSYYFNQIFQSRHRPGTISLNHQVILDLLINVLDEIGRNGFRKIILMDGHGGTQLSAFVTALQAEQKRPYVVYNARLGDFWWHTNKPYVENRPKDAGGHAGDAETSLVTYLEPETVKMENIKQEFSGPEGRVAHLPVGTPLDWYADFPGTYCGNARHATAETGKMLVDECVKNMVNIIKAVKADTVLTELTEEFHRVSGSPGADASRKNSEGR